jgi:hypothetical protein
MYDEEARNMFRTLVLLLLLDLKNMMSLESRRASGERRGSEKKGERRGAGEKAKSLTYYL